MTDASELNELIQRHGAFVDRVVAEVRKVIVGQGELLDRLLIALVCGGHVLVEGVPGLAKTLAIRTLAETFRARFSRIQFTPDLLPADIVGTVVYVHATGQFTTRQGPIFANLVLADEVNRAPAKVQSALLEAMQERQVTIGDATFPLPDPFLVMATQNPIEHEGTYPLPEAQVDRFMLKVLVGYPSADEEREIMERMTAPEPPRAAPAVDAADLGAARAAVHRVYVDGKIREYIVRLVTATRAPDRAGLGDLRGLIEYGASPRASIFLHNAARAHAFLRRRGYVTPEDVKAVAPDVLRHRVILTWGAEAEEVTPDQVVRRVLDGVEVP